MNDRRQSQRFGRGVRRSHHIATLLLLATIALSVMTLGCAQDVETVTLELAFSSEGTQGMRSLLPDTSLTIDHYTVTGTGPNEAEFHISSTEASTSVPGLPVGGWTIEACGWNDAGVRLISGTTTLQLAPDNRQATVTLDQYYGSGQLSVLVVWDDSLTFEPQFRMYITQEQGTEQEVYPTVAAGSAAYAATLSAGSYVLRCELYSEGELIAGCVEAVRIADALESGGTITFDLDTLDSTIDIIIDDDLAIPVEGTITGLPAQVESGQSYELSFTPTNVALDQLADVAVVWYLDGAALGSGPIRTITPSSGTHRIDVLAWTSTPGSIGSISLVFEAALPSDVGTLTPRGSIVNGSLGAQLDGVSDAIMTPDGLLITAAKISDTIQTYRFVVGSPTLLQTISNSAEIPLNGVRRLVMSADGTLICALSDYSKSLTVFSHIPGTDTLQLIEAFSEQVTIDGIPVTIGQLNDVVIDDTSGNIYCVDRLEDTIFHFFTSGTEIVPIAAYTYTGTPEFDSPRTVSLTPDGSTMAIPCYGNSSLHLFTVDPVTGIPVPMQSFSYATTGTVGISSINTTYFLDDDSLFTTSNDFLCEFRAEDPLGTGEMVWVMDQRISEGSGVPSMSGPKHVTADSTKSCIYVTCSTSKGITTFRRAPGTGLLTYEDFLSYPTATPLSSTLSADGYRLFLPSSSEDTLYIMDVTR